MQIVTPPINNQAAAQGHAIKSPQAILANTTGKSSPAPEHKTSHTSLYVHNARKNSSVGHSG